MSANLLVGSAITPPKSHQSISFWAAAVVPGTPLPLTPRSPLPSSVTCTRQISFLSTVDSPPSEKNHFASPLTAIGYASAFVDLPNIRPRSVKPAARKRSATVTQQLPPRPKIPAIPPPPIPTPLTPSKLRQLKPMSILRAVVPKPKTATSSKRENKKPAKNPADQYSSLVMQDVLLRQFECGGSTNKNAAAIMQERARRNKSGAVDAVYRDGSGRLWLDAAERDEVEPLVGARARKNSNTSQESFGDGSGNGRHVSDGTLFGHEPSAAFSYNETMVHPASPLNGALRITHNHNPLQSGPSPPPQRTRRGSFDGAMRLEPPPPGKGVRRRPEPLPMSAPVLTSHRERVARGERPFLYDSFAPVPVASQAVDIEQTTRRDRRKTVMGLFGKPKE